VACHWIRGKDHTELLWIVGDAGRFNPQGATPTNTTGRDVLRSEDENDWHTAEEIRLLASLAALFHDFGKANSAFQQKLKGGESQPIADAFRHEWVSLRLFEAFVGEDDDESWLRRLADGKWPALQERLSRDGVDEPDDGPFEHLSPLARVIGWLVVSHHRLPTQPKGGPTRSELLSGLPAEIVDDWCGKLFDADEKQVRACWRFKNGLPCDSEHWRTHAARIADAILRRPGMLKGDWLDEPYVLHLARLALMLADHYYSGQPTLPRYGMVGFPLYANTDRDSGDLKQRLDEHLIGVEVNAGRIVRTLPRLARQLPRIARHKGFRQRSENKAFRWQDRAFDLATGLQGRSARQGFFGVNMASTGTGKTLANGRIAYGLADPRQGARFTVALGLRTLTLQTGDAFRERLRLGAEDMAVLVGGGAIRELHEQRKKEAALAQSGAESSADLLPDQHYVHFDGSVEDGPLNRWLGNNPDAQKLLNAPLLSCTIDHLMPATEGTRGGHQIAPMLRLLSSDLILDEPDDFGLEDLPALSRLVHWAGLLGSRVLLSSATLPPALVQGLFQAYFEGRRQYQRNRGIPGQGLDVCCAWFDEFGAVASDQSDYESFALAHRAFVDKRLKKLAGAEVRRRAEIKEVPVTAGSARSDVTAELARQFRDHIHQLHRQHGTRDPESGHRVSFGLIRMANIGPLTETARALAALGAEEGCRLHLCVYHSQHPLLVRSKIEETLDRCLDRTDPDAVFHDPEIRALLTRTAEPEQVFLVLATAVAEVGRDHDYDWAVVEPSSMRSIVQLAGRVRRHRAGPCQRPNLYLLDTNVRHLSRPDQPAFCRPGFESPKWSEQFRLKSHRLTDLLTSEQLEIIDARSRIRERPVLDPTGNLVDLEHATLRALMFGEQTGDGLPFKPNPWWWTTRGHLSGELQRAEPFRWDPEGRQRYGLLPNDEERTRFHRLEQDGQWTDVHNLLRPYEVQTGPRIQFWAIPAYEEALARLAERLELEPRACAERFGIVDLPGGGGTGEGVYRLALGFARQQ